ncbi:hypothetical protein AUR64_06675 [Haloprofundus marisrubri]|uniref:DUF7344 domain-containing protein n=1 Tax=Haloprofundus marisrubri TaxID=1514971 RepID=A0A0W1RBU1_9EURY|nr:hypothetical protein [Haloprofundus marisrubri]KTG10865.1 hypothetical protein AUR64_06675 [Haloprofundus marisrubri]
MDDDSFDSQTTGGNGETDEPEAFPDAVRVEDTEAFPLDAVFQVLNDPRRRYVLYHIESCRYPATLSEVAEQVAAWEYKRDPERIPNEAVEQVRADLHHSHLPKLSDAGIVEYDADANVVTMAECTRPLDEFVEFTRQYEQYQK